MERFPHQADLSRPRKVGFTDGIVIPEFVRERPLLLALISAEQPVFTDKREDGVPVPKVKNRKGAKERSVFPCHGSILASLPTVENGAEYGPCLLLLLVVFLPGKLHAAWRLKTNHTLIGDHYRLTVLIQPVLPVVGKGNVPLEVLERFFYSVHYLMHRYSIRNSVRLQTSTLLIQPVLPVKVKGHVPREVPEMVICCVHIFSTRNGRQNPARVT